MLRLVLITMAVAMLMATTVQGQTEQGAAGVDYARLLSELKPKMTFEFLQDNLNAYLRAHPDEFAIPEGFESPHIAFFTNVIEVSARTKILFVPARVRVGMTPEVHEGRLRLKVTSIKAGKIPVPPSFHHGTAETIARVVNEFLERNQVQLQCVAVRRGAIMVSAAGGPASAAGGPAPTAQPEPDEQ
ncbi:MAG: hypothetical protein ABFE07_21920 [Armatimonadia bacterium]